MTVVRVFSDFGVQLPMQMADVSVCLFACGGILNAALYGYTRRIFSRIHARLKDLVLEEGTALERGLLTERAWYM